MLTFTFGTVGSGKTADLLRKATYAHSLGHDVVLWKPAVDTRSGARIESRNGEYAEADLLIPTDSVIAMVPPTTIDVLYVDEAQFLNERQIDVLRSIAHHIPVHCYGLRTDFRGHLFPGAAHLLALADEIRNIESGCDTCGKPSTHNMRVVDGKPIFDGPIVQIGGSESYRGVCAKCYVDAQRASHMRKPKSAKPQA